jgi:SAM-dependent methyltransferase
MLHFSEKQWQAFRNWLSTPLGQTFLDTEAATVAQLIQTLFGYHLMLMGEPQFVQSILKSPIYHRVWIHPYLNSSQITKHQDATQDQNISPLSVRFDKLSIANDSVDVIYLAHCLERIANPHEVLREVYRSLLPEGHVIITGMNPWSLWGGMRFFLRYIKRLPWDGHFISVMRLSDWLSLLGFEMVCVKKYFFRPPIPHIKLLQRLKFLETIGKWFWPFWGAGYIVMARKRIITITRIRPQWQTEKSVLKRENVLAET